MKQYKRLFKWWSGQGEHQKGKAEMLNDTKDILDRFRDQNHRVIGHLFSSPPRTLHHSHSWLRDWALVELDVEKFGEDLTNIVYIGGEAQLTQKGIGEYNPCFYFAMQKSKSLKLDGYIPEDDMKHPKMCLIVGKRSPTTGVTWVGPTK